MFSNLKTLPYLIRNYSSRSNLKSVFASRNANLNKVVAVKGWIKAVRGMKENVFLDINDGSCGENLQLVCNKSDKDKLGFGASIEAVGILNETPKGQLEVKVDKFTILGDCPLNEGYPYVAKQSYPPEYVRQNLHLRSRVSSFAATLRCRHNLTSSINNYLNDNEFLQIHTPILTANDCEGAGEVFKVNPDSENLLKSMRKNEKDKSEEIFFNRKVFLTVSGQLHLEAMSHGLSKVYTFGPTFRAENSKSAVHLSEFYMLELEESFIESLSDVVSRISSLFKHVSKDFLEKSSDDILRINKSKDFNINNHFNFLDKDFPTISYNEAFKIVDENRDKFKKPPKFEDGLSKEQEIFLAKYFEGPLFVVDWPKIQKSFYMREKKDNPDIVEALDFIIPNIGEVAGGSVREDNYNTLKSKMPTEESLKWYLELRKYGGVTTGGFGMGFERYLQFLLNIHSIKDVIPFPRWPHNCNM
ncbi:unnamed protein product [Diamesa hyperborea]